MIHTRIQLDPPASVGVRPGSDEEIEIVAFEDGDASMVISLSREQMAVIVQQYTHLFK